jgi:adenosylhomocysteine nucleosidase
MSAREPLRPPCGTIAMDHIRCDVEPPRAALLVPRAAPVAFDIPHLALIAVLSRLQNMESDMKTLIVIPMQEEFDFFVQGCQKQTIPTENVMLGRIAGTSLPTLHLAVAPGGLGKTQFAVQTQHLIECTSDWELVICAGAAGGIDDAVGIGDVVIGTETVEYDIQNKFGTTPLIPRFQSANAIVDSFNQITLRNPTFHVHCGAIASGDEDIVDSDRRREVRERTGALATAWEGAGGARASHFSGIPFIEIRGITDMTNETGPQDFEKNLQCTMSNVARVVVAWAQQQ